MHYIGIRIFFRPASVYTLFLLYIKKQNPWWQNSVLCLVEFQRSIKNSREKRANIPFQLDEMAWSNTNRRWKIFISSTLSTSFPQHKHIHTLWALCRGGFLLFNFHLEIVFGWITCKITMLLLIVHFIKWFTACDRIYTLVYPHLIISVHYHTAYSLTSKKRSLC